MFVTDRRLLLAALSASLLPPHALAAAMAPQGVRLGPARPFSFAGLVAQAKKNAARPYKAPQPRATDIIKAIDFDAAQKIKFRPDHALWRGLPGTDPAAFFHLSKYSNEPVVLQKGGRTLLRFSIYTPGAGQGATAVVFHGRVPVGISPRAELHFPTQDPQHPLVTVAGINGRCCEALFNALVQVPPQAVPGKVELRLTFPDWTDGAVRGSIEEVPLR